MADDGAQDGDAEFAKGAMKVRKEAQARLGAEGLDWMVVLMKDPGATRLQLAIAREVLAQLLGPCPGRDASGQSTQALSGEARVHQIAEQIRAKLARTAPKHGPAQDQ